MTNSLNLDMILNKSTRGNLPPTDNSMLLRMFIVGIFFVVHIDVIRGMTMQLSFPESREQVDVNCSKGSYYHNESHTCHRSRQQGPCPTTMIFYKVDKIYGDCDCPEATNFSGTAWVYDLASDQCFKMYQRAFCGAGDWLVFNESKELECISNKCLQMQKESKAEENDSHPVILYKDKCARLLSSNEDCKSPFVVVIDQNSGMPVCSSDQSDVIQSYDIGVKGSLKCRTGTRRDRLGKCRPINSKVSLRPSSASAS